MGSQTNLVDRVLQALSNNKSRVAIVLAPVVAYGADKLALYFGLDPAATLIVVVGVLAHFGVYIHNNGLQENGQTYRDQAK